jgi:hypothetical protein
VPDMPCMHTLKQNMSHSLRLVNTQSMPTANPAVHVAPSSPKSTIDIESKTFEDFARWSSLNYGHRYVADCSHWSIWFACAIYTLQVLNLRPILCLQGTLFEHVWLVFALTHNAAANSAPDLQW